MWLEFNDFNFIIEWNVFVFNGFIFRQTWLWWMKALVVDNQFQCVLSIFYRNTFAVCEKSFRHNQTNMMWPRNYIAWLLRWTIVFNNSTRVLEKLHCEKDKIVFMKMKLVFFQQKNEHLHQKSNYYWLFALKKHFSLKKWAKYLCIYVYDASYWIRI